MPWSTRNSTISVRLCAAPHSADATMKPATESRNRLRDPIRSESQPVIGIAIAVATR